MPRDIQPLDMVSSLIMGGIRFTRGKTRLLSGCSAEPSSIDLARFGRDRFSVQVSNISTGSRLRSREIFDPIRFPASCRYPTIRLFSTKMICP
jgi:hypothetical protein